MAVKRRSGLTIFRVLGVFQSEWSGRCNERKQASDCAICTSRNKIWVWRRSKEVPRKRWKKREDTNAAAKVRGKDARSDGKRKNRNDQPADQVA